MTRCKHGAACTDAHPPLDLMVQEPELKRLKVYAETMRDQISRDSRIREDDDTAEQFDIMVSIIDGDILPAFSAFLDRYEESRSVAGSYWQNMDTRRDIARDEVI